MSSTIGTKRQRVKDIPDSGIKPKRAKLGDRVVGHLPLQREKFKELFASLKVRLEEVLLLNAFAKIFWCLPSHGLFLCYSASISDCESIQVL